MNKEETPAQVEERARKIIRSASRQYGFPVEIERLLETSFPRFCFEFQRCFRANIPPETARSAGLTLALNIIRETINATTAEEDQVEIIRKAVGHIGASLLNAAQQPKATQ